ncbi:SAM-dependent methyltransferase [Agromyces sp. 3263]|uniref:class I SAM-dependent methyltransferase n=1 Tax=Agromyces sp. 3263 TaxID=2817750 RepID=UPI0028582C58|nr:class I SAM-dependent methyltransferase [Agromyces sp. 3263]MDR6906298.1 SAM-dependent methyltransferase [Agromyces sp. 3263]
MGDTTTVPDFAEESVDAAASSAELDGVLWDPISTAAVSRSHPRFDERVLDACCGDGASALPTAELVGIGGLVDAVDDDASRVALARERAGERMPQLRLHVDDVTAWEPTGYDLVQCVLGLERFAELDAATRHLIERARPGGRVAITAWAKGALEPLPELVAAALSEEHGAEAGDRGDGETDDHTGDPGDPGDHDPGDDEPGDHATAIPDTAGTLAHWLTELGLVGVRADAVQRHVDLTPDLAWRLVQGTGMRAMLSGLDEEARADVRERFLAAIAEDDVQRVDLATLIAVGHRPE